MTLNRAFQLALLLGLWLGGFSIAWAQTQDAGPQFVKTVRVLTAQRMPKARLLYWDQALSDILGLHFPAGRVGEPAFDEPRLEKFNWEIKGDVGEKVDTNFNSDHSPYLFVEDDYMRGSGRSAYVPVEFVDAKGEHKVLWVNIKGLGTTGVGMTKVAGPPQTEFDSHRDGSATYEEGGKEAIEARRNSNELTRGGNRILALIETGRVITYPDGTQARLVTIVRGPMERFDQDSNNSQAISDALAEHNAKRSMKGDFVNPSNMGAGGETVDMGTNTFTGSYGNFNSSQDQVFFKEGFRNNYHSDIIYSKKLGYHLLLQLGIPEPYLKQAEPEIAGSQLAEIYQAMLKVMSQLESIKIDFAPIEVERLKPSYAIHHLFQDLAADYFLTPEAQRFTFAESQLNKLAQVDPILRGPLTNLIERFVVVLEIIERNNGIKAELNTELIEAIRNIAHFKNRDISNIMRPELMTELGNLAKSYPSPRALQDFIDSKARNSRLGTHGIYDNGIVYQPVEGGLDLYVRVHSNERGEIRLYEYPRMESFHSRKSAFMRLKTTSWQSALDLPGEYVQNRLGEFFKFHIKAGAVPLSEAPSEMTFFSVSDEGVRWPLKGKNIQGMPLMFNELLGLPASQAPRFDLMRFKHGVPTSFHTSDLSLAPGADREAVMAAGWNQLVNDQDLAGPTKQKAIQNILGQNLKRHSGWEAKLSRLLNESFGGLNPVDQAYIHFSLFEHLLAEEIGLNHPLMQRLLALLKNGQVGHLNFNSLFNSHHMYKTPAGLAFLDHLLKQTFTIPLNLDAILQQFYLQGRTSGTKAFDTAMLKHLDNPQYTYFKDSVQILHDESMLKHPLVIRLWEKYIQTKAWETYAFKSLDFMVHAKLGAHQIPQIDQLIAQMFVRMSQTSHRYVGKAYVLNLFETGQWANHTFNRVMNIYWDTLVLTSDMDLGKLNDVLLHDSAWEHPKALEFWQKYIDKVVAVQNDNLPLMNRIGLIENLASKKYTVEIMTRLLTHNVPRAYLLLPLVPSLYEHHRGAHPQMQSLLNEFLKITLVTSESKNSMGPLVDILTQLNVHQSEDAAFFESFKQAFKQMPDKRVFVTELMKFPELYVRAGFYQLAEFLLNQSKKVAEPMAHAIKKAATQTKNTALVALTALAEERGFVPRHTISKMIDPKTQTGRKLLLDTQYYFEYHEYQPPKLIQQILDSQAGQLKNLDICKARMRAYIDIVSTEAP